MADRPAGFAWRLAAACVDGLAGFGLAVLFSSTAGMFFARRAVVTLAIGEPSTWWQGPVPMVLGAFGEVVYLLPAACLVAWALDPLTGATLGKRTCGLRVRDVGGRAATSGQQWRRWAIETAGFSGWTLALLVGRWELAAAATLAGGVVAIGCLAVFGSRRQTLHDRVSRTSVFRARRAL